MAADGAKSLPAVTVDYGGNVRHDSRVDLHAGDVQDLLEGPEVRLVQRTEDDPLPAYLAPLGALGGRLILRPPAPLSAPAGRRRGAG
jgi:hypothetical protein